MTLTVGELFAGVGGFGIGFERAGFEVRWQVEINPDCVSVLERHWPTVRRYGDVRDVDPSELEPVDVVTFGSPCQDLSVAGKRAGLEGSRSGLFYEAARIVAGVRPVFAVWENVAGALSSHDGRDFLAVLDTMAESGALDICGRILDAQGVGDCQVHRDSTGRWSVPQRRRRIFLVSDYRGERAYSVLFDGESVRGDSEASGETGQGAATVATSGVGERDRFADGVGTAGPLERFDHFDVTDCSSGPAGDEHHNLVIAPDVAAGLTAGGHPNRNAPGRHKEDDVNLIAVQAFDWQAGDGGDDQSFRGKSRKYVARAGDYAGAVRASGADAIAYPISGDAANGRSGDANTPSADAEGLVRLRPPSLGVGHDGDPSFTISANAAPAVGTSLGVRRLTPRECERLMGWPDDHTRYRADGREISDAARYRMIGNGVAANVSEWLARRLAAVLAAA